MKRLWDRTIGRALILVLGGLIRAYQLTISPMLGPVCKYHPSCSNYALVAIQKHGAGKGVLLAAWRVVRCNPWSKGGVDQVPPKGVWRNSNKDRQVVQV